MRTMARNSVTTIPIIHPVGITDRISFVFGRGGGFVVWWWFWSLFSSWRWFRCSVLVFLVFVFVVAAVSLFVVDFSFFF